MTSKIGVVFLSDYHKPTDIVEMAREAEESGVDKVWVAEHYCSTDAFAVLGALAVKTSRVMLGSGIVSPLIRHPVTIATAASTLASLCNGRFILGVGAGVQLWVESYLALPYHPVLSRMAESVKLLRELLEGGNSEFAGRWFRVKNAKIKPEPTVHRVPIYLGAVGEKMKRLAFEVADGLILSAGSSLEYVSKTSEELKSHRVSKDYEIVVFTFTCVNSNSRLAKEAVKSDLAAILSRPGRAERMLASMNLEPRWFDELRRAVMDGNKGAISRLITDEIVGQLAAAGNVSECLDFLSRLMKHQAVSVALVPCGTDIKTVFKLVKEVGEDKL